MKGHVRTLNELTADPWIWFLALLIAIVLMFFVSIRVEADMSTPAALAADAKEVQTLPSNARPHQSQFMDQAKQFSDYSDISHERAGSRGEKQNLPKDKRGFFGKIGGFFEQIWVNDAGSSPGFTSP